MGISLDVHFLHAAAVNKIIDVVTAQRGGYRFIDIGEGYAQRLCFFLIDIQFELRRIFQPIGPYPDQLIRMLFHHAEQLVSRLGQGGMAKPTLVDQLKVEAGGGTQLNNCRHVERENHGVFYLAEGHGGPFNNRLHVVFITATRFPGFQADKRHAGVLPLAAEAEAVNGKDAFNIGLLVMQIVVGYGIQHLLRALLGRAGRQLDHGQEDALILVGQKGRGQTHEQHGHPHDYHQVDHQITACSTQNAANAVGIVIDALVKAGVKPAEKSFFLMVFG